eukprot:CAMPEP_0182439732 /NCGR_PEP_ID=MMETSP1167-20130531/86613_1 /TAXON_ID=2988 /ORGANISM="Mallomonas Sp, Strain CCMP3275" /LENGTH=370 /DNA_ID=CAMNT_0024633491 /DNA_START=1 /DNA_END=1116 /DNA_ORIENTATION=-
MKLGQLRYLRNMEIQRREQSCDAVISMSFNNEATVGMRSNEECVICQEALHSEGEVYVLPCGHRYHQECIEFMIKRQSSKVNIRCPECRQVCRSSEFVLVAQQCTAIGSCNSCLTTTGHSSLCHHCNQSSSKLVTIPVTYENTIANDTTSLSGSNTEGNISDNSHIIGSPRTEVKSNPSTIAVEGQWGTKVTAILSDVLSLPADHKCVIFSQWAQMLDIVAAALHANSVRFERFEGQRQSRGALSRFRSDPSVSALLLSLKSGAQGLTLVEACHVFLCEPLLNLEQEAQAVNRVHRIGQTRSSIVHRYIIHDTIEDRILNISRESHSNKDNEDNNSLSQFHSKKTASRRLSKGGDDTVSITADTLQRLFH